MELKMKAPIKLHKVSNDAVAENRAPKKEEMFLVVSLLLAASS